MDATHVHLMINHIPILVTPLALLILIWGVVRDISPYRKLAMWGFLLAGITAYIAFESGEGAEETVEQLAGISEDFIHDHEEMAEWSLWTAIIVGLLSIAGFYIDKIGRKAKYLVVTLLIVLATLSTGLMAYTAYLGGQIRHSEIRPQQTQQVDSPATEDADHSENEH